MPYWSVAPLSDAILITCAGHDREGTVGPAVDEFARLAQGRERFLIIADLREMTGYETVSRQAWQGIFFKLRKQIAGLVLVGARSTFIRMGATTVALFAGISAQFVDSWDQLPEYRDQRPAG